MRKISLLIILILAFSLFVSCEKKPPDNEGDLVRVMVSADEGAEILGDNPVSVLIGESVSFDIKIKEGYVFSSSTHGTYDSESGKLTVSEVTERLNISFTTKKVEYDTTKTFKYVFNGADGDTTSIKESSSVKYGTVITVKANDNKRIFVGWSLGLPEKQGGVIVSTEREYTLTVSPDITRNDVLIIYANYKEAGGHASNIYYYDANGGTVNPAAKNLLGSPYYTVEADGSRLKVTLGESYYNFMKCASTFYDDGSFTRDGYVLREYNTKPDGSGEAYSLGSKFFTVMDGENYATLYCIWEKASDGFTYVDFEIPRPAAISKANSPEWNTSGVKITGYSGDEEKVVVPERIDGKPVIAIAADTFVGKRMNTLVLSRHILSIEDGAIKSCSSLKTVYFPDGVYSMTDSALDAESYTSLKNLYVNAVIAPRYSKSTEAAFAVKLSRLIASESENRIIVISGSSSYQGLGSAYLEALLDNEYTVINFGTTRTTHGTIYLEAMKKYAHEGDLIIYAPENSSYMLGERELYWKTLRDLEGMYNFFRYIDISNYTAVFSSFASINAERRYQLAPRTYEEVCTNKNIDAYGDKQNAKASVTYNDAYYITFNNRCKSKFEGAWSDNEFQYVNKDYTDPNNQTWCSFDSEPFVRLMNISINAAKSSGAKVYFGFAPVDASSIVEPSKSIATLLEYDAMIERIYDFDGLVGSSKNYIYDRKYFYDCAFHTNYYGRAYRTYQLYLDIGEVLGYDADKGFLDVGVEFAGCAFEEGSVGAPITQVEFLKGE